MNRRHFLTGGVLLPFLPLLPVQEVLGNIVPSEPKLPEEPKEELLEFHTLMEESYRYGAWLQTFSEYEFQNSSGKFAKGRVGIARIDPPYAVCQTARGVWMHFSHYFQGEVIAVTFLYDYANFCTEPTCFCQTIKPYKMVQALGKTDKTILVDIATFTNPPSIRKACDVCGTRENISFTHASKDGPSSFLCRDCERGANNH